MTLITALFNPSKTLMRNYEIFQSKLPVPALVAEAYLDAPLTQGLSIQAFPANVGIFQKERLLNILAREVSTPYIAWLDCDIVFHNPEWYEQAIERLDNGYDAVQLFQVAEWLRADGTVERTWKSRGFEPYAERWRHTGFAWAAKREVFPLFDYDISGGGDVMNAYGFLDREPRNRGSRLIDKWRQWKRPCKVSYVPGRISHLFHGTLKNRKYEARRDAMEMFDPDVDIRLGENRLWEWTHPESPLRTRLESIQSGRDEDLQSETHDI